MKAGLPSQLAASDRISAYTAVCGEQHSPQQVETGAPTKDIEDHEIFRCVGSAGPLCAKSFCFEACDSELPVVTRDQH